MRNSHFIITFISAHVICIALQIYKSNCFIETSYRKQQYETTYQQLEQKKQELTYQLNTAKNVSTIRKFAQHELGMQPISLTQIKTLSA
ncbi:MAG TPA: hypothetical protein VGT41_04860 [Candidatus Babeliales bacterium]|nr:hypothetical protein [Candidatus Babeliales bacterium]